jgi:predicted dehydrogenase
MSEIQINRRMFLGAVAAGSLAAAAPAVYAAPARRRVRVGIVGYGYCRFGADFGFQDHPDVQIVAVSDLIPERRAGLMKACRCEKSHDSLEQLVKDPDIEAVFIATDAPSHARHAIDAVNHGKHVMVAVPAVWGSLEDAERLLEAVGKSGMKYHMAETSVYRADCHAMRAASRAGALGKLVYSEGEYFHHQPTPLPSFNNWRVGSPPMWYPTHSTAYYTAVSGGRLTSVSCMGFRGSLPAYQPGANRYDNPFTHEVAIFQTSEGGTSRMIRSVSVFGYTVETGRVFGERGRMDGTTYHGQMKSLPDLSRPPLPPGVPAGGHGGSHGPLTHEFISAILEDRQPLVNIHEALAMTVPGIIAHQSAMKDGQLMKVPQYDPGA